MDLRSFVVDLTTKNGDPSIIALTDVLFQRLLNKVSVDADTPGQIQPVGREECRSSVDSVFEGGVGSSTETFQGVCS